MGLRGPAIPWRAPLIEVDFYTAMHNDFKRTTFTEM